ncbi:MAG: hypothetical protein JSU77_08275 [Fidelibacterota bacterium]|nr:MAG: hypothetical protein JSU77_08275 [Candidatus Neomarinimicrobiota bacterium]
MKRILYHVFLFIFLLIVIVSAGCNKNPDSPPDTQTEKGSWAIYTPYDWTHDGQPYQSIYCTIYSDAASDEMKQQLGEIADEKFSRILELFNFDKVSDFIYPPDYSKIEIYINRNHAENINWAYWGGFIFTIRSPDISGHWYDYATYTISHEMTHEFEFLIEGKESLGTEVWFKEGIAVYTGCLESPAFQTIELLSELESWIAENENISGQGIPVKIHQDSDFPSGADIHQYFRFFELALRYLLDQEGFGRSYQDVLNLFYDLRQEVSFPVSFEDHFGISVSEYEGEFYSRMKTYLDSDSQ